MKRVTFRVPAKTWERLQIEAVRERTSVNEICVRAITAYFDAKNPRREGK